MCVSVFLQVSEEVNSRLTFIYFHINLSLPFFVMLAFSVSDLRQNNLDTTFYSLRYRDVLYSAS